MPARRSPLLALAFAAAVCPIIVNAQSGGSARTIHGDNGVTLGPPPVAAVHVVTDDYHGIKVEDSYQWLEDAKSPETRAWIDQENAYTQQYLSQLKNIAQIASGLTALMRVDEYGIPIDRGGKYFFRKRLANENQGSLYMRAGWRGEDQRLVDATKGNYILDSLGSKGE